MLRKLTEKYIAAFSAKDLDGVAALMADDFALEDPVVKQIQGKAAALRAVEKLFTSCDTLSFSAKNIYQDGNFTFIEFILKLDDTRLDGVDIIEWRDGKMTELHAYLDIPKG